MSGCANFWMKNMGCVTPLAHPIACKKTRSQNMRLTGKVANDGFKAVSEDHYMTGHHKIPRIWIVLADRHKLRVFMKPDGHLEQIAEAYPQDNYREKGIPNHSLGRMASSASKYIRHRLQPHIGPTEKNDNKFVQEIADWLENAVHANAFDRLIVAASPKMLGDLRKTLSDEVQARIVAEIDKDLTKMPEKELFKELKEIVWF